MGVKNEAILRSEMEPFKSRYKVENYAIWGSKMKPFRLPGMDPGLSPGDPRGSWAARSGLRGQKKLQTLSRRTQELLKHSPRSLRRILGATYTDDSTKNT